MEASENFCSFCLRSVSIVRLSILLLSLHPSNSFSTLKNSKGGVAELV